MMEVRRGHSGCLLEAWKTENSSGVRVLKVRRGPAPFGYTWPYGRGSRVGRKEKQEVMEGVQEAKRRQRLQHLSRQWRPQAVAAAPLGPTPSLRASLHVFDAQTTTTEPSETEKWRASTRLPSAPHGRIIIVIVITTAPRCSTTSR